MKGQRRNRRQKQIHTWTGRRDQYRTHARKTKCAKINRHRLRITEQEGRTE
jgi:hypothetical protein